MERDNRINWIIALLVVNFVAMLFIGYRNDQAIDTLQRSYYNDINDLRWQVANMDDQLVERFESILIEQNNKVDILNFEIAEIDIENLKAEVNVSLRLKEKEDGTDLRLNYSTLTGIENTMYLDQEGPLVYKGIVLLSLEEDYKWTVIEVGPDSAKVLNEIPTTLELRSEYYTDRGINSSGSGSSNEKEFYMENEFEFELLSLDSMAPEKIEMTLLDHGEVIRVIDVTKDFLLGEELDDLYKSRDAEMSDMSLSEHNSSSGHSVATEKAITVKETESVVIHSELSTKLYGLHYFYGTYKDYGISGGEELYIRYRVTYKDGYVQDL